MCCFVITSSLFSEYWLSDVIVSQGSVATHWVFGGIFKITLLQLLSLDARILVKFSPDFTVVTKG